ncbi:hypothetical protein [Planktothrix sp. FACHB-1365]|uniref:hypothetical protein n=1 Tax=Planktothrix sp. FACHB-1365 TaxID=2692855 RepID=UPI00168A2720|nr:hypothetical protein [Planktothrix sp. FACHB-1365]MBD2485529.1 hypothetical protein [Planktothrix sp. FACHB-1365]
MLTTHVQKFLELSTGRGYQCYGDNEDPNQFYVIPATPTYKRTEDGKALDFTVTKYDPGPGKEGGGFCTFTVVLPFPNTQEQDQIKQLLSKELNPQLEQRAKNIVEMLEAYKKQPQGEWKTFSKELGYTDQQVDALAKTYQPAQGWQQFIPTNVKLNAVPFTQTKTELLLKDSNSRLILPNPIPPKPSGFGDNNTIFNLELTENGATFLEKALKEGEGGSIAGVRYEMSFEAVLPPAEVTVFYKSSEVASFARTIDRNVWGQATEEKIKKELEQKQTYGVKVGPVLGQGWTPEQKNKLEQELRDWGNKQLTNILKNQTEGLDISNLGQHFQKNPDKVSEVLSKTVDINITYSESRSVEHTIVPQLQLPTISNILKADGLSGNELQKALDNYFKAYNLVDDFYRDKTLQIVVNGDFDKLKISYVRVDLEYLGCKTSDRNKTVLFEAKGKPEPSPNGGENKKNPVMWSYGIENGQPVQTCSYTYEIGYANGKTFKTPQAQKIDGSVLNINIQDIGIARANIKGDNIDWQLVDRAQVTYKFEPDGLSPIEKKVTLTQAKPNADEFVEPLLVAKPVPVKYNTEFVLKDGSRFVYAPGSQKEKVDWATDYKTDIYIEPPFLAPRTYTILPSGLDSNVRLIASTLKYTVPALGDFTINFPVSFQNSSESKSWKVPTFPASMTPKLEYDTQLVFNDGNRSKYQGSESVDTSFILVGIPPEQLLNVVIDETGIQNFAERFERIKVQLLYEDAKNGIRKEDENKFIFQSGNNNIVDRWSVPLKEAGPKSYKYRLLIRHKAVFNGSSLNLYWPVELTTENTNNLDLSEIIKTDAEIAAANGKFLVKVTAGNLFQFEPNYLAIAVNIEYGSQRNRLVLNQQQPVQYFVAERLTTGAIGTYKWLAQIRKKDGSMEYHPSDATWISSTDAVVNLESVLDVWGVPPSPDSSSGTVIGSGTGTTGGLSDFDF